MSRRQRERTTVEHDAGPFDPGFDLRDRSRAVLAVLGREYLLAGHLQDRASMPQILARFDRETMAAVAIDEWMGASPVYTRRMQRALGFEGDDVATIFKGLQLDIGAPHQFMDFRYRLDDAHHGEFWLDCCGALMDVEPMGEPFVQAMCHDIEDPTFDATAVATNPRARVRPIHRPPREPADREPHCRWKVFVDPDVEPLAETDACREVARSRAATLALPPPRRDLADGEGRPDYSGPFDPDFQLEDLSHGALLTVLDEVCLQGHLLVRSLMRSLAERFGEEEARDIARAQFRGVAPVVAQRIANALRAEEGGAEEGSVEAGGAEAVARVLRFHPAFRPRSYVTAALETMSDGVRFALGPAPVFDEGDDHSWIALLASHPSLLDPVAQAIEPRARCCPVEPRGDEVVAWHVAVDQAAEPAAEPSEVALTRFSTGADFVFVRRRPVSRVES